MIEEARHVFDELPEAPPPQELSKGQAIEMLTPRIMAMYKKGYSLDQIAATLSKHGIAITARELAAQLRNAGRNGGSRRRSKRAAERMGGDRQPVVPEAGGERPTISSGGTQPATVAAGSPAGAEPIGAVPEAIARAAWAGASESPGFAALLADGENAGGIVPGTAVGAHGGGTIYWVGGDVGGVGKSMLAAATIHLLREEPVLLVEADSGIGDVWKAHHEHVASKCIDLWCTEGWASLVDVCRGCVDTPLVINTPTGIGRAVDEHGARLDGMLGDLHMDLVVLWVIGRRRDSLESLREFIRIMPHAKTHVVRNDYFGEETAFEIYNGSNIRRTVHGRGGQTIAFPRLADSVVNQMDMKRLCIAEAMTTLAPESVAELESWWKQVRAVLKKVVDRPTLLPA